MARRLRGKSSATSQVPPAPLNTSHYWDAGACGPVSVSAQLTGTCEVDIGLGNSVQEMEIGETMDGSANAGDHTTGSNWDFGMRVGCGGDGKSDRGLALPRKATTKTTQE